VTECIPNKITSSPFGQCAHFHFISYSPPFRITPCVLPAIITFYFVYYHHVWVCDINQSYLGEVKWQRVMKLQGSGVECAPGLLFDHAPADGGRQINRETPLCRRVQKLLECWRNRLGLRFFSNFLHICSISLELPRFQLEYFSQ